MSLNVQDVDFGAHGVIYVKPEVAVSEESDNENSVNMKANAEWLIPVVHQFLKILHKQMILFDDGKIASKKIMFENCAKSLEKLGYVYTHAQCENKWKGLKRRFYNRKFSKKSRFVNKESVLFTKIEDILKIEKPYYMEEIQGVRQRNEELDHLQQELNYTENDERIVKMVLDEQSDEEVGNVENLYPLDEELPTENNQTCDIRNLRKLLKEHTEKRDEMFKTLTNNNEQILTFLQALDENEKEKLVLKKKKLATKEELLQQTKIQNSLIAKLIQKIDGKNV